jgi:hypothetical protein
MDAEKEQSCFSLRPSRLCGFIGAPEVLVGWKHVGIFRYREDNRTTNAYPSPLGQERLTLSFEYTS